MPSASRSELAPLAALLTMTAAWGSTFFLIKDLLVRLPVADMLALRFGLGSLALLLIAGRRLRMGRRTVRSGIVLGLLYGGAQILQTAGLAHTAASVSGFLTGLYVVATPLLAALLLRTRISPATWAATVLATVGLAVLSLNGFAIGYGELLTVISALVYAGHILAMGRLSAPGEALPLSLVQMVVITLLCGAAACWPGSGAAGLQLPSSGSDWLALLYLAVVAGALTMVLQTWAQARIEPARAAVVMAMEPVWAAAFAVALGGERLTLRMLAGGLAILAAMYLVELAPRRGDRAEGDAAPAPADVGQRAP
nr:DMT family transporter [uncultured Friedmanniella sp.]